MRVTGIDAGMAALPMRTSPPLLASQLCAGTPADTPLLFSAWAPRNEPAPPPQPQPPPATSKPLAARPLFSAAASANVPPQPLHRVPVERNAKGPHTRQVAATIVRQPRSQFGRKAPLLATAAPASRIPAPLAGKRVGADDAASSGSGSGGAARKSCRYSSRNDRGGRPSKSPPTPRGCRDMPSSGGARARAQIPRKFGRAAPDMRAPRAGCVVEERAGRAPSSGGLHSGASLFPGGPDALSPLFNPGTVAVPGRLEAPAAFGRGSGLLRARLRGPAPRGAAAPPPPVSPEVNPLAAAAAELGFTHGRTFRGYGVSRVGTADTHEPLRTAATAGASPQTAVWPGAMDAGGALLPAPTTGAPARGYSSSGVGVGEGTPVGPARTKYAAGSHKSIKKPVCSEFSGRDADAPLLSGHGGMPCGAEQTRSHSMHSTREQVQLQLDHRLSRRPSTPPPVRLWGPAPAPSPALTTTAGSTHYAARWPAAEEHAAWSGPAAPRGAVAGLSVCGSASDVCLTEDPEAMSESVMPRHSIGTLLLLEAVTPSMRTTGCIARCWCPVCISSRVQNTGLHAAYVCSMHTYIACRPGLL